MKYRSAKVGLILIAVVGSLVLAGMAPANIRRRTIDAIERKQCCGTTASELQRRSH